MTASAGLLAAVADALMPGVSIEDDGALGAALAPVIRAPDFAAWSRADREALVGELLADPGTPAGVAVARVLQVAARTHYGDPGSWPGLGYRPMPPGTSWPPEPEATPAPIAPDDLADEYDVIVIGAGAGGGVAACVLAEAGRRVLLVERGESLRREDLPRDHLRNARVFTGLERQVDPPAAGNPRFVGDAAVAPTEPAWNNNAMTVGGGTRVYGGQAWRFCPEDFRMRSTYGEPFVDWPLGYDDLAPFYERVEWELGVCGADAPRPYDGARSRGYPMPPFAPNAAEPVLARGAEALGLATGPVPLLINSVPYGGRPACIRCGTCAGFACHAGAKNGSHNTTIMRAVATGRCDLLTGAAATRLITQGSRVVGAELARAGRPLAVRAAHVVVAAGAIETARLLLASEVGTAHDQVGRYLQGHVYAGAVGVFDEPLQDCVGPGPSISTTDHRHHNDGILGGGILANEFVPIPIEAYRSSAAPAWSRPGARRAPTPCARPTRAPSSSSGRSRRCPPPPRASRSSPPSPTPTACPPCACCPLPASANDVASAEFLGERAEEWLRASGARTTRALFWAQPTGPSAGQHQAGSCRMGTDPRTSVTDPWGRVWGHDGVTIADGSLHVTNGGVNPVLTILALAWRVSERLAAEL